MGLEARVERLEKENRWLKRSVLGMAALIVVGLAVGAEAKRGNLDAENFVVRDAKGKVRGRLGLAESGPVLSLYDAEEKARAVLTVGQSGPFLTFLDATAGPQIVLSGAPDAQGLVIYDVNRKVRATLAIEHQEIALKMWDAAGKTIHRVPHITAAGEAAPVAGEEAAKDAAKSAKTESTDDAKVAK